MGSRSLSQRSGRDWDPRLRDLVRETVAAHQPADEREIKARDRVLRELDARRRPFDEDDSPVHVTGSAVVAGPRGTVLHLHKRLHRWLQPGGHVDPGEAPWQAALRESEEETGLKLVHPAGGPRLIHVDVHDAAEGHVHLDLRYLLLADDAEPSPAHGESPHVHWFGWQEAEERADVALAEALRAAIRQPEVVVLREVAG